MTMISAVRRICSGRSGLTTLDDFTMSAARAGKHVMTVFFQGHIVNDRQDLTLGTILFVG